MTSYKLCLTAVVLASLSVTANCLYNPSNARANNEDERPSGPDTTSEDKYQGGYRFGDEYFLPEASKSVATKHNGKLNGCERVIRDSMVCMVCKDPKTNEKYEQCSYVVQPKDKGFAYTKERSSGNPENRNEESDSPESSGEANESSEAPRKSYEKSDSSEPGYNYEAESRSPARYTESSGEESENSREPAQSQTYDYPESQEDKQEYNAYKGDSNSESSEDPAESSNCRQVQKDGQTCTICKDPKTGSDLERCSSSYRPDDKSYAYGTSEKYGTPHSGENYEAGNDDDKSSEASGSYESSPSEFQAGYLKANDDNDRNYHESEPEETRESNYDDRNSSYDGSSSEYTAPSDAAETKADVGEGTDCREVRKDSMTCTVCKDPKNGGNFQKCSYNYKPDDKVYKFSKSKNYGYPDNQQGIDATQRAEGSSNYPRRLETKRVPKAVKANNCRKVQRDSKICTVCEDPITGENSEQCAYSYKPKEKHFGYVNSRSVGNPRNEDKGRSGASKLEGQQESRQVPKYPQEERRARSEKNIDTADASPCKQIVKDSMTCTVCKDPKTGASSEQCAYSSEPKEKLFKYSKSNSFPKRDEPEDGDRSEQRRGQKSRSETGRGEQPVENNPCRQIIKDSMTCTICKDPKTGENSEQCAYGSKPKKQHFTYSKSKSFGNPRKRQEGQEESRQILRKIEDGQRDFVASNRPRGFSKPIYNLHS